MTIFGMTSLAKLLQLMICNQHLETFHRAHVDHDKVQAGHVMSDVRPTQPLA